jgi:hypothetical protein
MKNGDFKELTGFTRWRKEIYFIDEVDFKVLLNASD